MLGIEQRKIEFAKLLVEWMTKYNDLLDRYAALEQVHKKTVDELASCEFKIKQLEKEMDYIKRA